MSKVYDRVECGYLKWMINNLHFLPHFTSLIMNCVVYVSFRVLMNGFPVKRFKSEWGLR